MKGYFSTAASLLLTCFLSSTVVGAASDTAMYQAELPDLRVVDHRQNASMAGFVRFAQCQVDITTTAKPRENGILGGLEPERLLVRLQQCLDVAITSDVDVLVMPEYASDLPEVSRLRLFEEIRGVARDHQMIVIAGSFIDSQRYNRIAVFGPGWEELGYKMNPSRYEVSYLANKGVVPGESLLLLQTDYGRFLIITCVDLISDEVQFIARHLATRGEVDVVININHNPAAWEFLIEANSIARRHPVFVSITNVTEKAGKRCMADGLAHDSGSCAGHSAIFAAMDEHQGVLPADPAMLDFLPAPARQVSDTGQAIRALPYDRIAADMGAFDEGALIYDLNILRKVVPKVTNAPDQGYPSIRNIHKVVFQPLSADSLGDVQREAND